MKKFKFAFLSDFQKFILRGNVMDMAVGVIIGAAFGKVINSLVYDIMMPLIGLLAGSVNYSNLFIALSKEEYKTIAEAKAAGVATLNYGEFITVVINFLIMAFSVFIMIRAVNRLSEIKIHLIKKNAEEEEEELGPTLCPYCFTEIDKKSKKCKYCTADLPDGWQSMAAEEEEK